MSLAKEPIKIINGALAEENNGTIVLRGVLAEESLDHLLVDSRYQRELVVGKSRGRKDSLLRGLEDADDIPPILLGMRGEKFESKGNTFLLYNPCYIIDGQQRVGAMQLWRERHEDKKKLPVSIGVQVYFGTDYKTEAELFDKWNANRLAISPSIMLRNKIESSVGVRTMYNLSTQDNTFALCGRVTWTQQAARNDLIKARTLCKVAYSLMRHLSAAARKVSVGDNRTPGSQAVGSTKAIPAMLDRVCSNIGYAKMAKNVHTFFDAVDQCWGLRNIVYTERCPQTRDTFLLCLAILFADHEDFWGQNNQLNVTSYHIKKLRSFPLSDPDVDRLCSSGSMAIKILYNLIVDHLNKHVRSGNRLKRRKV